MRDNGAPFLQELVSAFPTEHWFRKGFNTRPILIFLQSHGSDRQIRARHFTRIPGKEIARKTTLNRPGSSGASVTPMAAPCRGSAK